MRKRRLFWQLFPSYLLIVIFALAGAGFYVSRTTRSFLMDHLEDDLKARAEMVAVQAAGKLTFS